MRLITQHSRTDGCQLVIPSQAARAQGGGDLRQAHAGEDDGDAQPLDDAERLAEDDHGDEQACGELRGGHDGGEARGQVRRAHAEEQDRAEQAKEAGDDGKGQDALGEDARDDVVRAHRERHDHGARAHDDAALLRRAGGLDPAGEGDEEGAGHGRPQRAEQGHGVVPGDAGLVDAAREHRPEDDDQGGDHLEGPRRPARHDGLPHEPQPRELEEECECHRSGQHAHGVAVENRGEAGEGPQAHELEGELPAHALPAAPERVARERGEGEEEAAEPCLARHHLRRGEAHGVGELVGRGHGTVAGTARKDLERRLSLPRARGTCSGAMLLDCVRFCHHASFRLLPAVGRWGSSGLLAVLVAPAAETKSHATTARLRGEKVAGAQKNPRVF